MQSNVIAPWAEPVSGALYPMRVADMALLPDDTNIYEIVEGRLVFMPASGAQASRIAARLIHYIMTYAFPALGEVTAPDGTYDLTQPGDTTETALVPDVAFVRAGRLPPLMAPGAEKYPRLAPYLVAEIASPSQYHPEMAAKAKLYLERGVRLVWVIWPAAQEIDLWRPDTPNGPERTLRAGDSLDGFDVIPGFNLPVISLFT